MASKNDRESLRAILMRMLPDREAPPAAIVDAMLAELLELLDQGRRAGRSLPPRAERIDHVRAELQHASPFDLGVAGAPAWSWRAEIAMAASPDDLAMLRGVVRTMSLHGLLTHGIVPDGVDGLSAWLSLDDVLEMLGFDETLTIAGAEPETLRHLPLGLLLLPDDHPALTEADPNTPALEWLVQRHGNEPPETMVDDPVLAHVLEAFSIARAERRWLALVSTLPTSGWGQAVPVYDEAMFALRTLFDAHLERAPLDVLDLGRAYAWRVRECVDPLLAEPTLAALPDSGWQVNRGHNMGGKSMQRLTEQLLAVMRDWRTAAAAVRHPDAFEATDVLPTLQSHLTDGRLDLWTPLADQPDEPAVAAAPTGRCYELEVTLDGSKPRIWRRFLLPADATFAELHHAIQSAFAWNDEHLWEFRLKRQTIATMTGEPEPWERGAPAPAADELPLAAFFEHKDTCEYLYDFGDSWLHTIKRRRTVDLEPDEATFRRKLLAGRQPAPPEDCGGIWGYYALLDDPEAYGWDAESLAERHTFDLEAERERFDC